MPDEDTPKPNLLPTVEGYVTGIVCLDPFTLQCGECGSTVSTTETKRGAKASLVRTSGYRFHTLRDWPVVRLCPDCRMAKGCDCHSCADERRCYKGPVQS